MANEINIYIYLTTKILYLVWKPINCCIILLNIHNTDHMFFCVNCVLTDFVMRNSSEIIKKLTIKCVEYR